METKGRFVEYRPAMGYGALNTTPQHVVLIAHCGNCDTMREIDRSALDAAAGPASYEHIEARLRCRDCGHRGGKIVTGFYRQDG